MNKVARKGLVTAMVAGGVLASAGYAQADAAAGGLTAGSPGVLSGNSVQVPVHVPVNVCGNTVDVVALLNPAFGNTCANVSGSSASGASASHASGSSAAAGAAGHHSSPVIRPARHAGAAAEESGAAGAGSSGGAHAAGRTTGSPGVLAGNSLGLPIDVPVNVSGDSVNVVGIGNPSSGDTAVNSGPPAEQTPTPPAHQPVPAPPTPTRTVTTAASAPTLAHTGSSGLGWAGGVGAACLLGGAVLYRRARAA